MQREHLASRLGFILLSAGCAIGVGNVWKFPYVTGENGGGFFVLIYLLFLIVMGIPMMTVEFALGRASQKSPAGLYQALEPKGTKWHLHGYAAVVGNFLLMMFYTVVTGWLLRYFVSTATGAFDGMDSAAVEGYFGGVLADYKSMIIYTAIVVALGVLVCLGGVQKGLERITKYMMIALLVIMVGLAVRSILLPDGREGLAFYLMPNVDNLLEVGIGNVIVAAMNQSFFTLSLGIGSMAIFGSYLKKDRALMGESVCVAALDTFVAITAGLIIFPACFAYGIKPDSGPNLIFVTLPNVFNNMAFGKVFGALFFVFLSFAALSTIFAVFENIVACTQDLFGWSRKKACIIDGIALLFLSMPCVFGFNLLSGFTPFGEGTNVLDLEDFILSNILLPIGSLCYLLFTVNKRCGWGWGKFTEEANTGKGLKVAPWMRVYMTYVLPVLIVVFFIVGLYNFFK